MLTSFNKIVLTIASIILIIALITLGVFLKKSLQEYTFPPVISDCPDYWDVSYNSNNNSISCQNISTINKGMGTTKCNDFNPDLFKSNGTGFYDVLCEKYKWARECRIAWDGVTNNVDACKNSSIG